MPPRDESELRYLQRIVEMSAYEESGMRKVVGLPFLEELDAFDIYALSALYDLVKSASGQMDAIASHPELQDSRTEADGATILLLVLRALDPESAAAIESMQWVQDGIASREVRSDSVSRWEQSLIETLVGIARDNRPIFVDLAAKPWIQDELFSNEAQLLFNIRDIVVLDPLVARRLIVMPFLDTLDWYETTQVQTLVEISRFDKQLPSQILAHPLLAGGMTDNHLGTLFLVVTELVAPNEVGSVRAFAWVQDGIAESDLGGLQQLHLYALSSPQTLDILNRKSWVQDGISREEQRLLSDLYFMLGWFSNERRDEATTQQILTMPFLQSYESGDIAAFRALSRLYDRENPSQLQQILSHPKLRDGITDEQTWLVSMLPSDIQIALEFLDSQP